MLSAIPFFPCFLDFQRLLRPSRGLFIGSGDAPSSHLWYGIACLKIGVVVVVWDWLLWILFVMPPPHLIYIFSNCSHDQTIWASGGVWISKCLGDQGPTIGPLNQPPTGLQDLCNWTFLKKAINYTIFSLFLRFLEVIEASSRLIYRFKWWALVPFQYRHCPFEDWSSGSGMRLIIVKTLCNAPPHLIYIWSNKSHDKTLLASGEVWISKCPEDQGPTFGPLNQTPTGLQDLWNC